MKNVMKKATALLLAVLVVLAFAGCAGKTATPSTDAQKTDSSKTDAAAAETTPVADGETIVIRVNSAMKSSTVEDTANGRAILQFVDNVNERTNGKYQIKLFMDSQLGGSTDQVVGGLQTGAFEMCTMALGSFGEFTQAFMPFNFPYMYSSADVVHAVIDGPVGEKMRQQCIDDTGIRVLAFTELGYRHMTNSKHPIKTPDDIVGLKMRTMNDPYQISAMEALGAAVTPMAYSELFTALQQKVIDGQENPCQNIWTEKFYEVQDYMTTTKHSYTVQMLGISESYFQSLPEDVQTILLEEARNVELRNREELEAIDNEQLEELKKVMDVYELSDEEFAVFRDAASVAWDDAKNAMGEEYFDLLMSEVEKAEKG